MEKLLVAGDVQVVGGVKSGLGKEYILLEGMDLDRARELFIRHVPKVVLLDLGLTQGPKGSDGSCCDPEGYCWLEWMIENRPGTKVVVLTGKEAREMGYRAVGHGAYDFHQKPIELARLKMVIARAFHLNEIEEQRLRLLDALERSTASIEGIAGQCAAIRELFSNMQSVALEGPELVQGQTDAGRESAGRGQRSTFIVATPSVTPIPLPTSPLKGEESPTSPSSLKREGAPTSPPLQGEGQGGDGAGNDGGSHFLKKTASQTAAWGAPEEQGSDAGNARQGREAVSPTEHLTLREVRDRVEKGMITAAVGNCGGNMVRASELLGVSRPALYDLMKKHGLFKSAPRQ